MRIFNYSKIKEQTWDSEILGYIAAIYREVGKQEQYLKQRPEELEKLVEIAKIQKYRSIQCHRGNCHYQYSYQAVGERKKHPEKS